MTKRTIISPSRAHEGPQFPPLATQGSLCNLTFDEVQSQHHCIGQKPLNSVNLDELVKNMVSIDHESHLLQNPSSSSSSSSSSAPFLGNFSLNQTLGKKTPDEVWKEIVHQEPVNPVDNQQLALGETTLEEFLIHAGVVDVGNQNGIFNPQPIMEINPMAVVSQQADWFQFQMGGPVYDHIDPVADVGYSENHLVMTMLGSTKSATSLDTQAAVEGKSQHSDEMMEKTKERRQKRMIKNRESAARSRARKQAYTNQLELEVNHLRKTNSWLKKQKEFEKLLSSKLTRVIKYQLRRTRTALF